MKWYSLIHRTCHRLRRSQRGLAYLEFAISIPFLLVLLLGSIEVTRYILIAQKVEKVAVTLSDVVAQSATITSSEMGNIIKAAAQVMQPFTFNSNAYVIVTSVTQTGAPSVSNRPKVNWQYTGGGTWTQSSHIGTTGNDATLPTDFSLNDKDNVIIAEVFYNFTPLINNNILIGTTSIYKIGVYKPRLGSLSTLGALPLFWLPQKGALL